MALRCALVIPALAMRAATVFGFPCRRNARYTFCRALATYPYRPPRALTMVAAYRFGLGPGLRPRPFSLLSAGVPFDGVFLPLLLALPRPSAMLHLEIVRTAGDSKNAHQAAVQTGPG